MTDTHTQNYILLSDGHATVNVVALHLYKIYLTFGLLTVQMGPSAAISRARFATFRPLCGCS